MNERLTMTGWYWAGSMCGTIGTVLHISPYGLTYMGASLWHTADAGGTVTVQSADTAQGTLTLTMGTGGISAGTLTSGTLGFLCNGTSIDSLRIPASGTVLVSGSVKSDDTSGGTSTQVSVAVYWAIDEA